MSHQSQKSDDKSGDETPQQSCCASCDRPDEAEDMVACDSCEIWFHYSCAEVDASVAEQQWTCGSCGTINTSRFEILPDPVVKDRLDVPKDDKPSSNTRSKKGSKGSVSVASSIKSVKDRAIQLELEMLEEQEKIKEQELQEAKKLRQKKLLLQQQMKKRELELEAKRLAEEMAFEEKQLEEEENFRKAKLAIRQQSLDEKKKLIRQLSQRGSDVVSVSQSEAEKSVEKVEDWLKKSDKQTEGSKQSVTSAVSESETNLEKKLKKKPPIKDIPRPVPGVSRTKTNTNDKPKPKETGTGAASAKDADEERNAYSSTDACPTSRQLAARQVMGKDLPMFSGNAEEWPIWISNFERSTSTCGFSEDENLIRLQRCLKGSALEMVRSRLLTPNSVSHVIKTLRMRYGRLETLIKTLTEKIRSLPPPKMDNLENLVDFGMAVDNLVEHLKNGNQVAHLTNPSLLHDLVAKLPVDYRLKWAAFKNSTRRCIFRFR